MNAPHLPYKQPRRVAPSVLLVGNDATLCETLTREFTSHGYAVDCATSLHRALECVGGTRRYEAIVSELRLGEDSGLELCHRVAAQRPELPVVVVSSSVSVEAAVRAIRLGADDFLTCPFEFARLASTLERAKRRRALTSETASLRQQLQDTPPAFDDLLGTSAGMREVFRLLHRLADTDTTVLLTGETSTGKQLVARALHRRSRRRNGAFVAVDCREVTDALSAGGHAPRRSLFDEAAGGTLFLDGVAELPLPAQHKLMQALSSRSTEHADVRLVCATNVELRRAVARGLFREDLLHRLEVVRIDVPPLRARGSDVLLLAEALLARIAARDQRQAPRLTPDVSERLVAYDWPGNARELENVMESLVARSSGAQTCLRDLPPHILHFTSRADALASLAEVEKQHILRVMSAFKGNKSRAAAVLGLDRSTLYRKLDAYGSCAPPEPRPSSGPRNGSN